MDEGQPSDSCRDPGCVAVDVGKLMGGADVAAALAAGPDPDAPSGREDVEDDNEHTTRAGDGWGGGGASDGARGAMPLWSFGDAEVREAAREAGIDLPQRTPPRPVPHSLSRNHSNRSNSNHRSSSSSSSSSHNSNRSNINHSRKCMLPRARARRRAPPVPRAGPSRPSRRIVNL